MPPTVTYYIVPITDPAVTADDFDTAAKEAAYRAEAEGILYALVQDDNAVYFPPPSVSELRAAWGIPGVDFPIPPGWVDNYDTSPTGVR